MAERLRAEGNPGWTVTGTVVVVVVGAGAVVELTGGAVVAVGADVVVATVVVAGRFPDRGVLKVMGAEYVIRFGTVRDVHVIFIHRQCI